MKRIIGIYIAALAHVITGTCLNLTFLINNSSDYVPLLLSDFIPIRGTGIYASIWDCLIAAGFLLWAFATGVWYQASSLKGKTI